MKIFRRHKWDDDEPAGFFVGVHPSEFGIIIVALVIAASFIYLILTPQNWEAFDQALIPASERPAPTAQVRHPGETEMILFGAKPAPTAKGMPAGQEAAK